MAAAGKKSDENKDVPPIPTPAPAEAAPVAPVEPPPAAAATPPVAPPVGYTPPPPPAAGYAPPPGYGAGATSAYPPANPQPTGLALASLICGIAGLVLVGLFGSIAAIITGHLAQRRQPWARPLWLTGLVTGYVGLAIWLVLGVIFIFVFIAILTAGISSGYSTYSNS